jgi:outer membrane lipoprotein SlyB
MKTGTMLKRTLAAAVLAVGLSGCGGGGNNVASDDCRNIPGAVVGGVAGGLVGSQIGGGHGRDLAIGAGAATGAVVGSNYGC